MKNGKEKIIVLLTNGFPYGKTEPYLQTEIGYLAKAFNKVTIVPLHSNGLISEPLDSNVQIVNLSSVNLYDKMPFLKVFSVICSELPMLIKLRKPIYQIRYFRSFLKDKYILAQVLKQKIDLAELLKNNDVIIYSYWLNDLALISSFLKNEFPKLKTISRGHGFDLFEDQTLYNFIPFRNFQLNYIDKIYSVSKRGEFHLKKNFPGYENKIFTSYLGTIDGGISKLNTELVFSIATCSIIRNIKRLELMVDILKNIDFKLIWHVIGNGPDEENLKKKCIDLPKNISVIFHGYYSQKQLFDFYKTNSINLFCSLSSSEGLPVSMMEAISFGIPIMSTNVGGCNEICNERTGFLIDKEFKAKEISSKITEFKDSDKNTSFFRERVREYWQSNFSADKNYRQFINDAILN